MVPDSGSICPTGNRVLVAGELIRSQSTRLIEGAVLHSGVLKRMSDSKGTTDPREVARQHTARLKALLLGKVTADRSAAVMPATATPTVPTASTIPPTAGTTGIPPSPATSTRPAVPVGAMPAPVTETGSPSAIPRRRPPPNPLVDVSEQIARTEGHLASLLAKTQRLAELNRYFRALLPANLQEHATLARLDADGWVVQTDSPVWASRLRYQLPELGPLLSEYLGLALPPPRIRVAPPAAPPPPPPPPRRMAITARTVRLLETAAHDCSDRRLGEAILRLAEHARQRPRSGKRPTPPRNGEPVPV